MCYSVLTPSVAAVYDHTILPLSMSSMLCLLFPWIPLEPKEFCFLIYDLLLICYLVAWYLSLSPPTMVSDERWDINTFLNKQPFLTIWCHCSPCFYFSLNWLEYEPFGSKICHIWKAAASQREIKLFFFVCLLFQVSAGVASHLEREVWSLFSCQWVWRRLCGSTPASAVCHGLNSWRLGRLSGRLSGRLNQVILEESSWGFLRKECFVTIVKLMALVYEAKLIFSTFISLP